MRKTMYLAMKNLAEYIAMNERSDFEEIWKDWKEKYKPLAETESALKEMGAQLCKIDKKEIKDVPERGYRETIKKMLQPEINKEELRDGTDDRESNGTSN